MATSHTRKVAISIAAKVQELRELHGVQRQQVVDLEELNKVFFTALLLIEGSLSDSQRHPTADYALEQARIAIAKAKKRA